MLLGRTQGPIPAQQIRVETGKPDESGLASMCRVPFPPGRQTGCSEEPPRRMVNNQPPNMDLALHAGQDHSIPPDGRGGLQGLLSRTRKDDDKRKEVHAARHRNIASAGK